MNTFAPYAVVAFGYIASPGPAVFLVISNAIRYGLKKSLLTVYGNSVGLMFLAFLFSLGVTELLNKFPLLILIMRITGALYLLYLGTKALGLINNHKKQRNTIVETEPGASNWSFFKQGFLLASTNPKPILFFAAIFPQFLSNNSSLHEQFFILSAIFLCISFLTLSSYGLASSMAQEILTKGKFKKFLDVTLGTLLIFMSFYMLYETIINNWLAKSHG